MSFVLKILTEKEAEFLIMKLGGEIGARRLIRGENPDLLDDLFRPVHVDSKRTLRQALDATGRNVFATDAVLETAPLHDGGEVGVYFFKLGRLLNGYHLECGYEGRNSIPIGPRSLAAVNEEDMSFADSYPNGTLWEDHGKWYLLIFDQRNGVRRVRVTTLRAAEEEGPLWVAYSPRIMEMSLSPAVFSPSDPFDGR